jgi:2-polyprenyl-3-methyl-5-hydroxy-6-metoxy-1,4-benzoquinol methylase
MSKNEIFNVMKKTLRRIKTNKDYVINTGDIFFKKKCPICDEKKFKKITSIVVNNKKINETVICSKCFNVYRKVSPKNKWFEICWKKIEEKNPKEISINLEKLRKKRYLHYYSNTKKYLEDKSSKILDIGSAFGTGIGVFRKKGFQTHCLEPEINRFKILKRKKFIAFNSTIEKFKTHNKYDLIIMSHSLEHCEDLNLAISKARSLLKNNNSILYVEVPNALKSLDFFDNFYLPHRNNFNIDNLKFLFYKKNFSVIKSKIIYLSDEGNSINLILKKKKDKKKFNFKFKKNYFELYQNLYNKRKPFTNIKLPLDIEVDHIKNFFYIIRKDRGNFHLKKKKLYFKHFK